MRDVNLESATAIIITSHKSVKINVKARITAEIITRVDSPEMSDLLFRTERSEKAHLMNISIHCSEVLRESVVCSTLSARLNTKDFQSTTF